MKKRRKQCLYLQTYMGKIYLKNIRLYAFHGCMDEEEKIGSDYVVNVIVESDLNQSSISDDLKETVDYVSLHAIVKEEMFVRSMLLENVANRILKKVFIKHKSVSHVKVKVAKINPPISGNVEEVAVEIELNRSSLGFD